jgi:7-cyano-7-deazaguanine synthase in queuosine biosynthesis
MTKILNNKGKILFAEKVNEDVDLLEAYEEILRKRRGYIIKMPKRGESVLACLSGGQDSVANIGVLLKEFGLNVYPFFINRGQSNYQYEKKAADFFDGFYKERFPDLYHPYREITVMTPGSEYKDLLRKTKRMVDDLPLRHNISYPARGPLVFLTGMEYAYSLQAEGINITSVFASNMSSDFSYHCSQTWVRLMNLMFCQILNDWTWQFISLPIETELVGGLKKTLFFGNKDRVNLVVYGNHATYYSLGIKTEGDYAISFPADLKIAVPGGYGQYRVGALGKLVSLEKKPQLLQNTFSLATYSFTDYYFYITSDEVFYGQDESISVPSIKMLWSSGSNASLLDRIYLIFYFLNKKVQDFHQVTVASQKDSVGDDIFAAGEFQKKITGYLFQQSYRREQKSVQILYANSYTNASRVSKMLEGNGIKVGDISQEGSLVRGCLVKENNNHPSMTAEAITRTFHCRWEQGNTFFYDIQFELGEKEKEWEIK